MHQAPSWLCIVSYTRRFEEAGIFYPILFVLLGETLGGTTGQTEHLRISMHKNALVLAPSVE